MENCFGKFSIYELLNKCGSLMFYYKVIEKFKRVNGIRYFVREIFYKRKMWDEWNLKCMYLKL